MFQVLVIGAGSTGLTVAQGLKQAGISFAIYERTDASTHSKRARDWSMGLHWSYDNLTRTVPESVVARLPEAFTWKGAEVTPHQQRYIPCLNGETGELIHEIDAGSTRRASRRRLTRVLSEGLQINYGHQLSNIQLGGDGSSVTAYFLNGKSASGSLLVGCDSSASMVRTWLLGDRSVLSELPVLNYNFTTTFTAEQALWIRKHFHPVMQSAAHPKLLNRQGFCTLDVRSKDPSEWVFQIWMYQWAEGDEAVPETSEARLAHYKSLAAQYGEPFRSVQEWIPEDTWMPRDKLKHWDKIVRWTNHGGRVTLAGDAAHPMAPHRAQGLNVALRDAALLVDALKAALQEDAGGRTVKQHLDAYDEEVFEWGSKEIASSAAQVYPLTHFDAYMGSLNVKRGFRPLQR